MLCRHKNIFGAPGTGAHAYRIFDIAIIDVVFTILAGLIIYWIVIKYSNTSEKNMLVYIMVFLFLLGIVAHRLFGVRTTIDKLFFSNNCPEM